MEVAIVGMGCRLPGGVRTPEEFWQLLRDGVDAITQIPADRFDVDAVFDPEPGKMGKLYTRSGGFIQRVEYFDADFFGVSPREASRIDPQQRLLLEVAWEALEDAGHVPGSLAGSRTGVFVGISSNDYGVMQLYPANRQHLDGHSSTGVANSIAANRLSYLLDLRGPSLIVDTACSSSLTAVHLACRSLASGECELAIVGGVNLLLTPEVTIGFCQARMLSPSGRCRTFDAAADGFVRAEGAGVLVLKPLQTAREQHDRVYAVIRGSAINQDGRTTGLMVPSSEAQQTLIREALDAAGVEPSAIQYVEAHGTGTPVGDPLEAAAIGAIIGRAHATAEPCLVGSAKTNVGHLEAGAGVVGLMKAALMVKHREIPPDLHFTRPNPAIPLDKLHLRVPTQLEPWPGVSGPAIASVNSFGFGGANAHVVVQEPPPADVEDRTDTRRIHLLPLSAHTPDALRETAERYRDHLRCLAPTRAGLVDVCYTSATRRTHHAERVAVIGGSPTDMADALDEFLRGAGTSTVVNGRAPTAGRPKVAFVFSGMGLQWWGMGRALMSEEPLVREVLENCDRITREWVGWSLLEQFSVNQAESRLDDPEVVQVVNCALQVALSEQWRAWGIVPDAIVGHSAGEMAAAYAAGVLDLRDTLRVAAQRGRLAQRVKGTGAMLAVAVSADAAQTLIERYSGRVQIAAFNGPESVTLSGERAALDDLARSLQDRSIFSRLVLSDVPYHGPSMVPLFGEMEQAVGELNVRQSRIPIVSATTGDWATAGDFDATYWARNLCQPVRFNAAVDRIAERQHSIFVEVSAHPGLAVSIKQCLGATGASAAVLPTLRRGEDERSVMLRSLAALHVSGYPVNWRAVYPFGECVSLPSYPWQAERYWLPATEVQRRGSDHVGATKSKHPLLGWRRHSAQPTWEVDLGETVLDYLDDHRVEGNVVLPGAASAELLLAGAREVTSNGGTGLEDVEFERLLLLEPRADTRLQVVSENEGSKLTVFSAPAGDNSEWSRCASARVRGQQALAQPLELAEIRARCWNTVTLDEHYADWSERGLEFGPAFRCLLEARSGDTEWLARVGLPPHLSASADAYHVHPCLLDAAFQTLLGAALETPAASQAGGLVVAGLHRLQVQQGACSGPMWAYALVEHSSPNEVTGNVWLADDAGRIVVACEGVRVRLFPIHVANTEDRWLYELAWEEAPPPQSVRAVAAGFRSVTDVAEELRPFAISMAQQVDSETSYAVVEPVLNGLARGFAHNALQALQSGESGAQPVVVPAYRRLVDRLTGIANGWSEPVSGSKSLDEQAQRLAVEHPDYRPLIELVRRCGEQLAGIALGHVDARELLFSTHGADMLESVFSSVPWSRLYNSLAGEAIAAAARDLTDSTTLRVLEVGAGLGGTTYEVLSRLPAGTFEYTFTDLSPFFLAPAAARFAESGVRVRRLDIEQDPVAQGFAQHSFDVIVAANVLHATADLRRSLENVKRLLAPGGLLMLQELTRRSAWLDVIFGCLEGWWHFTDIEWRPTHPILHADQWQRLLKVSGFEGVGSAADEQRPEGTLQTVFVARAPDLRRRWLVFADRGGVAQALTPRLEAQGDECVLVYAGQSDGRTVDGALEVVSDDEDGLSRVLSEVGADSLHGVLHFWSLDLPASDGLSADALMEAQRLSCGSVLALAHLLERAAGVAPDVWLFTTHSQPVDGSDTPLNMAQAPLWGLGRSLMTELFGSRCRLVDLSPNPAVDELNAVSTELNAGGFEEELALRGDRRLIRRIRPLKLRSSTSTTEAAREVATAATSFQVELGTRSVLDTFALRECPHAAPGRGQVTIQTRADGLNFKEVLLALGALPSDDGDIYNRLLGLECAGTVVACGGEVEGIRPGDEVLAFGAAHFASHLITSAELVVPKPADLTFEEAVTVPTAFLTAHYGLNYLAHMTAGERVLIHAATGGVGLAAVQLCHQAGVEIFATAGSPQKRSYLESLGIQHVMDSRSLAFADEILERTNGEGVDVILNSLAGEAIQRGLDVLRPGGRFLEIGKRDILQNSSLGLKPFLRGLAFFSIDLARLIREQPALIRSFMVEILAQIKAGALHPLPHTTFDIADVRQAVSLMAQARHMGKVVLTIREPAYEVLPPRPEPFHCRSDATYLITGGLGGFGLAVAQWLVARGAQHIVLMSRSGSPALDDAAALKRLRASSAEVVVLRGDVGVEAELAPVLDVIRQNMPPLRGIIHAAMVLDDDVLLRLNQVRFRTVMTPKVAGAWNLHNLTLDRELDFFVLFSSIASIVGNQLQANYAAANSFLDVLAAHRRRLGLPGLTVNWGALSGVGYVSRHAEVQELLGRVGFEFFSARWATDTLGRLLASDRSQVIAAHMDWRRWLDHTTRPATPPPRRYTHLLVSEDGPTSGTGDPANESLMVRLRTMPTGDRADSLQHELVGRVARIFGSVSEKIDVHRPLIEMGMDSLMAVELSAVLRAELGAQISSVQLLQGASVSDVARRITGELGLDSPATPLHVPDTEPELVAPLSHEQRRLWFVQRLAPESPAYNVAYHVRLSGPLDHAALERSLTGLVQRHQMLRASFSVEDGEPVQRIVPRAALQLTVVDLSGQSDVDQQGNIERRAAEDFKAAFDLRQPPLLRLTLIRLTDHEHVLLTTAHHLICDSATIPVLLHDLAQLYAALEAGLELPRLEPATDYLDYVRWQQQLLTEDVVHSQLAYWKARLADAPEVLRLPTNRAHAGPRTTRGGRHNFEVSRGLATAVLDLAQRESVTAFMVLMAAFQAFLHRSSGAEDVCIGTPVLTRSMPGAERMVGCAMNTVIIRTDLSGQPTFRELLASVRGAALGAFAHRDVPFDLVVRALRPERGATLLPFCQAMLVVYSRPSGLKLGRVSVTPLELGETAATAFDLMLLLDVAETVRGSLEYSADLLDAADAERIIAHFLQLLDGMVQAPDRPIAELPMLTDSEQMLLATSENNRVDFGDIRCLPQLVAGQSRQQPDAVAVQSDAANLTFRALERRSNRAAARLQRLGVRPRDLVAVCGAPSLEAVVTIMAVLKSGAAYIPLDPAWPVQRVQEVLTDAQPRAVVLDREIAGLELPERTALHGMDWLLGDADEDQHDVDPPMVDVTPEDLAYVIYTSGSTGQPNGVMVSHRAIYNHLRWRQAAFPLTCSDAVLLHTPLSFDPSVSEIFWPLAAGARLVVPRPEQQRDVAALASVMAEHAVTALQVVPSVLDALLDQPGFDGGSLQRVLCGGEFLTRRLQTRFHERLPATTLVNMYGPTEATIETTSWTCHPDDCGPRVPIGRPIANVCVCIVDPQLQPVAVDTPGELLIGGAGLAHGYLNRDALTAERFVSTPFGRAYRSGDLAVRRADGTIELLGRLDQQVKIRGIRIEPAEIEAVLDEHPQLVDAAVVVSTGARGEPQLVAHVVARIDGPLAAGELREYLRKRLPSALVPARVVLHDRLPTLSNSKVDRQALVARSEAAEEGDGRTIVPPRSELELAVLRVWQELLELQAISVEDNFFDLGGHSLLAVRLLARLEQRTGHPVPLSPFLEAPTIEQLARLLAV